MHLQFPVVKLVKKIFTRKDLYFMSIWQGCYEWMTLTLYFTKPVLD